MPFRAGLSEMVTVILLPLGDQHQHVSHETSPMSAISCCLNPYFSHTIPLLNRYLLCTFYGSVARNVVVLALRIIRVERKRVIVIICLRVY